MKLLLIGVVAVVLGTGTAATWSEGGKDTHPPHSVRLTAVAQQPATSDCPPAPLPCGSNTDAFASAASFYTPELFQYIAAVQEAERKASFMHDHWITIGRCEQPGNGYGGIDWTVAGTFGNGMAGGGGLGISNAAWSENGGGEFASIPGGASPEQQMIVATRIYNRFGPSAWGCGS